MEYEPAFGKDLVCKSDEPLDVASPKREVFVKKLSELQEDNAIKNYRYSLGHNLINLAQGRFKLSKDQILKLDEADLEELALLIYEECLSSVRKFEIAKKVSWGLGFLAGLISGGVSLAIGSLIPVICVNILSLGIVFVFNSALSIFFPDDSLNFIIAYEYLKKHEGEKLSFRGLVSTAS